jgi:L-2-hydroxyglutarate oxidase LhgO
MDSVDVVIIGAGVVGLAIGARLARGGRDVVVVEQHDGFGRETSSRNSEVIHAGFYYPADTLKARLCVSGNRMLYELCGKHGIAHRKTGKIVVGTSAQEIDKIHHLLDQGNANGVEGLRPLTKQEIAGYEPCVTAVEGLWSPHTGIIDTHALMKLFEWEIIERKGTVAYQSTAAGIERQAGEYAVSVKDADGGLMSLAAPVLVNAAGLGADAIAAMAGIDIDACGYRIHPCKGEYFSVSPRHRGVLSHLVYPAPTPISLGVHAVLKLDNNLKFGPNAFYVDGINYEVDPSHQREFFEHARRFFPFLTFDDFSPDMSGIRPKLQRESDTFRDFVIVDEKERGLPGFINLVGIESPGLTSAPAIAELVEKIACG